VISSSKPSLDSGRRAEAVPEFEMVVQLMASVDKKALQTSSKTRSEVLRGHRW